MAADIWSKVPANKQSSHAHEHTHTNKDITHSTHSTERTTMEKPRGVTMTTLAIHNICAVDLAAHSERQREESAEAIKDGDSVNE